MLSLFTAEKEEKRKIFDFYFLGKKKNILNKILIFNFLFGNCSLMYKEGFCKFSKENSCLRSL